jgi:DNA topoisomerase-1
MFKRSGRGAKKPYCINDKCKNFLPEDMRGYRKKTDGDKPAEDGGQPENAEPAAGTKKPAAKKSPAKKPAAKKPAAKKKAPAKKKA